MNDIGDSPLELHAASNRKTGAEHLRRGEGCQDAMLITHEGSLHVYGLADGQSGKTHSAEGGLRILHTVAACLTAHGLREFTHCAHEDEMKYVIMRHIRRALSGMANELQLPDVKELSSTLVMIAVDDRTGEYMTLHLGDGAVIGARHDGSMRFISEPENGVTGRYTYLTTSGDAMLHLRISFGQADAYSRIIMLTDGASGFCRGKNVSPRARQLIRSAGREALAAALDGETPADDASIIVIDVAPRSRAAARLSD